MTQKQLADALMKLIKSGEYEESECRTLRKAARIVNRQTEKPIRPLLVMVPWSGVREVVCGFCGKPLLLDSYKCRECNSIVQWEKLVDMGD